MDYSKDKNRQRRKNMKSKKRKARNKARVIVFRVLVAIILITGFAGAGAVFGAYMGIIENAETIDNIATVLPRNYASIVYDKDGNEIDRYTGEENREYVTLDQIPLHLQNAFIAIEDERFYSHNGIDMRGIVRSFYNTVFQNNRQGASTLTQQLIKNNIMNLSRNSLDTKLQEQYLAVKYERMLEESLGSKEAAKAYTLEVYLNSIGLHHGLKGVQTASLYYFNKDVSELTLSESAVIAAITQRPAYYTPAINPENNRLRQQLVLDKMLELEFITEVEYYDAINDNVYERVGQFVNYGSDANKIHSYYSDQLIEDLLTDLQGIGYSRSEASNLIYNGGLQIHTPINPDIQNLLEETFMNDDFFSSRDFRIDVDYYITVRNTVTGELEHFEENFSVTSYEQIDPKIEELKNKYLSGNNELVLDRRDQTIQPQAAMAVIDYRTGYVQGIVGGRGEKTTNRGFNRATFATRQPGSVFKVLAAYAPAIDLGIVSPGTVYIDEPFTYGTYAPNNWYSGFRGASTIRDGIRDSMNVVTVMVLIDTGIDTAFNYLHQFGFTTLVDGDYRNGQVFTDRVPSLALGGITDGVTVLETTAAYGTIANGGVYLKPTFYTVVYDHDGNVLLEYIPEEHKREVLKPTSAYMLTDMMKDVITSGTGTRARLSNNMPTAGKTGTSQDTVDLVFAGYTPYYVAGIWYGYDKNDNLRDTSSYHLNIWKHVMDNIHADLPFRDFERPEGLTTAQLCADSGLRAVPGLCEHDIRGSRVRSDLVAVGNLPAETCNVHATITIDTLTGMVADYTTPEERRFTFVGVVVDDDKITDQEHEIPLSMTIPGSRTRLNSTFGEPASEDDDLYIYDPEGNIVGIQPRPDEAPMITDDNNETWPSESPNNGNTILPQEPTETAPQPIVTEAPELTEPVIDNEELPPINDLPPIME